MSVDAYTNVSIFHKAQSIESDILKFRVWNSSLSVILPAYVELSYSGLDQPREKVTDVF